jgi:uncharacterized protein
MVLMLMTSATIGPGHQAAKQFGVLAPLMEAGLSKSEIRAAGSLKQGLPSWDRPQAACLSSRFVEKTYITPSRLSLIDKLEQVVRDFAFRQVRVRYLTDRRECSGFGRSWL